jgi:hypothetical protein
VRERDREIIDRSTTMAGQRQVASMLLAAALLVATFASIPTSTDRAVFSVTVVVINSLIVITSLALCCCSIRCFICMCACKRVVLFAYINRNLNFTY